MVTEEEEEKRGFLMRHLRRTWTKPETSKIRATTMTVKRTAGLIRAPVEDAVAVNGGGG